MALWLDPRRVAAGAGAAAPLLPTNTRRTDTAPADTPNKVPRAHEQIAVQTSIRRKRLRIACSLGGWLPALRHVSEPRSVTLTFDDGPTPETTPALLLPLAARGQTATFFVRGVRASFHPNLIDATVAAGRDVFAHGWDHVHLDRVPPARLGADFTHTETLLAAYHPAPNPYFVHLSYMASVYSPWAHRVIAMWRPDAPLVRWSVSNEDVQISGERGDALGQRGVAAARANDIARNPRVGGAILALHEAPFGISGATNAVISPALLEHSLTVLAGAGLRTACLSPRRPPLLLGRCVLVG
jgi:peptidoglycan-N-acetylglucosamine deacetylase